MGGTAAAALTAARKQNLLSGSVHSHCQVYFVCVFVILHSVPACSEAHAAVRVNAGNGIDSAAGKALEALLRANTSITALSINGESNAVMHDAGSRKCGWLCALTRNAVRGRSKGKYTNTMTKYTCDRQQYRLVRCFRIRSWADTQHDAAVCVALLYVNHHL